MDKSLRHTFCRATLYSVQAWENRDSVEPCCFNPDIRGRIHDVSSLRLNLLKRRAEDVVDFLSASRRCRRQTTVQLLRSVLCILTGYAVDRRERSHGSEKTHFMRSDAACLIYSYGFLAGSGRPFVF